MKIFIIILSILFCLIATESVASNESNQRDFIKHLYNKNYFFRTITEAERFLFSYPDNPYFEEIEILIADSYLKGGDEESALRHYHEFIKKYPESTNVPDIYFKLGKLYYKNNLYDLAKQNFNKILINENSSNRFINKAKEWMILLLLLEDVDYEEVAKTIQQLNSDDNKELFALVDEYSSLNFKSPKVAGLLSLMPGAGQLYLNRKRDAAAAFILNGLFIWGMVESFKQDNVAVGVVLSVFEAGWYVGNIYSAVSGAHKHNRKLKDSFGKKFTIGLNINVSKDHESSPGFMLSFSHNF